MSLKSKLALFIAAAGLLFSLAYVALNQMTIRRSSTEQKHIMSAKVALRVHEMVENEKKRIATICFDWAAWDVMYEYATKPTREFESQSMPAAVIPEYDMNVILVINRVKKTIYHEGYDRLRRRPLRFDPGHPRNTGFWRILYDDFDRPRQRRFFSSSEHGPLFLVSAPILHTDSSGPMNGRVVMGRLINSDFNERLAAAVQEMTALLTPEQAVAELGQGPARLLFRDGFLQHEAGGLLRVYSAFADPEGSPVFVVRASPDAALFRLQERAARTFLASLLLSTLLLGLLLFLFVDRLLLRRLREISRRTSDITSFADLSIRVPEGNRDEIAQLSQNINTMLERLERESVRRREMEERLVLTEKLAATGRLAANIAHEVNNPLFAIANSIAVIKGRLKDAGGDVGEVLPLAEREIARVRKITRKLLDHGKVNLETFQEADLEEILDTACQVLKLSKQLGRTALRWESPREKRPLLCNADSLQQVFMNMIVNASEAMEKRGEVFLRVEAAGDGYAVHIRDTGPGFPESIQSKIFEPFNTSKDAKGAGLGLYISYHIVKRHGGTITLGEGGGLPSLTGGGGGAHLIVTLPRRGAESHEG